MAAQESSSPKYRRIAEALKRAIAAGEYRPGDRLPGENELMDRHGVARMTARQALGVLTSEGLAEARKGAGVFVRDFQPVRRRGVPRLAREQWGDGRSVWAADVADRDLVVDGVTVGEEPAADAVAARLDLAPGDAVTVRRRRFVLDGKPVLLSTSYLPADLVAGLGDHAAGHRARRCVRPARRAGCGSRPFPGRGALAHAGAGGSRPAAPSGGHARHPHQPHGHGSRRAHGGGQRDDPGRLGLRAGVRLRRLRHHAARRAAYSGISVIGGRSSVSTSVVCGMKPCSPRSNWVSRGRTKWPRVRRSWAVR